MGDSARCSGRLACSLGLALLPALAAAQVSDQDASWHLLLDYSGRVDGPHTTSGRITIEEPIDELLVATSEQIGSAEYHVRLTRVDGTGEDLEPRPGQVLWATRAAWAPLCARAALTRIQVRMVGPAGMAMRGRIMVSGRDRGGVPAGALPVPCATDTAALTTARPYADLALGATESDADRACVAHGGTLSTADHGSRTCAGFDGASAVMTFERGALTVLEVQSPTVVMPSTERALARAFVAPLLARFGRPAAWASHARCEPVFYDGAPDCWASGADLEYRWSAPRAMRVLASTRPVEHVADGRRFVVRYEARRH